MYKLESRVAAVRSWREQMAHTSAGNRSERRARAPIASGHKGLKLTLNMAMEECRRQSMYRARERESPTSQVAQDDVESRLDVLVVSSKLVVCDDAQLGELHALFPRSLY